MSRTRSRKTGPQASGPADPVAPWRTRIVGSGEEAPEQLLANPANWRVHPQTQQRALAGALDRIGWVQQVMVNRRTGHVVDGHARVALAISRHEASVPVLYVDLSEQEERLVLATLDPLGAMATADKDKLDELLAELSVDEARLVMFTATGRGGRPGATDPDDAPAPSPEPHVRTGDLWILGDHRLLCGDSTDPADVARVLDGAEPTLLATDPPYGVQLDMVWRDRAGLNGLAPAQASYMRTRSEGHEATSISGDTRADWSAAFELVPSLNVAYVWHAGQHARAVAEGLERIGFEIVSQIIWDKGRFAFSRGWYHWRHEPCWVARRPGARMLPHRRDEATVWHEAARLQGELEHPATCCIHEGSVWQAPSPKMIMGGGVEEKFDHPTQKPIVTAQIPIRNHLEPGEAVYEPFCGSGTTLMAAETLGRHCLAIEIDPAYVQVAIERWEAFTGRKAVLG